MIAPHFSWSVIGGGFDEAAQAIAVIPPEPSMCPVTSSRDLLCRLDLVLRPKTVSH